MMHVHPIPSARGVSSAVLARLALALAVVLPSLPACAHVPASAVSVSRTQAAAGFEARPRKPGDAVSVAVRAPAAPVAAGPATVGLSLQGASGITEIRLSYRVDGALRVAEGAPAVVRLDADHRATVEVPLTVLGPGVHYLHIFPEAGGRSSAVSVRVDAGRVQGQNKARAVKEEGGFVVLPAQETRR